MPPAQLIVSLDWVIQYQRGDDIHIRIMIMCIASHSHLSFLSIARWVCSNPRHMDCIVANVIHRTAALKALRIIGEDEVADVKPEDEMTPEQSRIAPRRARLVSTH
jgi:hypothetical protein